MVHNGNIVNTEPLAHELRSRSRRVLMTHSDTEIVLNLFAEALAKPAPADALAKDAGDPDSLSFEQICAAVGEVFARANGSYSIVAMIADHGLVAFRDPSGIRPLIWGKRHVRRQEELSGALPSGEAHCFASESVAPSFLGYDIVRDVMPGEVVFVDMKGQVHTRVLAKKPARHCMFEYVYFASPESVIDGVPVYGARINLGRMLATDIRKQLAARGLEADLIVPVPETSRIAAIALAEELKIPYREVLIKNRYIKRTFILDSPDKRQKAVRLKLSPVRSEIQGKRVILVDDSIVRGTTSRQIIELVRQAGASKVYFVSTCPPIQNPCYYGIDFPSAAELIASGRTLREIELELGADAVIYQDLDGLREALRQAGTTAAADSPCMACLDGKYPTDVIGTGRGFGERRAAERRGRDNPSVSALSTL
jgi:amidophosphoribosyltransferase